MQLNKVTFEGADIRCFYVESQTWMCGKDVCAVLGYAEKSHKVVLNKIDTDNIKQLREFSSLFKNGVSHHDGLMYYLDEMGVIELTMRCKFERAKPFKRFLKQTFIAMRNSSYSLINLKP